MKLIFFGSDDLAAAHLEAIVSSKHKVLACVTQPDKAQGRGLKVQPPAVKLKAQAHDIPVLQPADMKDDGFIKKLKAFGGDIFVVVAYGHFLPQKVLGIPPRGAINMHPSLLPKYRGAAPINWAIINGETMTGVTIINVSAQMDAGDILMQEKLVIEADDTAVTLREKLTALGARCLCCVLGQIEDNKQKPRPQDGAQATLAPKLTKDTGRIDWTKGAKTIRDLVRGLLPWPAAYTAYQGKTVKILDAQVLPGDTGGAKPGTVLGVDGQGIRVATGRGVLLLRRVHPESAKAMDAQSFAAGHRLSPGGHFG